MEQTTTNSRDIKATPKEVYNAFINPSALEYFQAPGDMTAKVHHFDHRVGGGYQMSLYYPEGEKQMEGKTSDKEDKFYAKFVEMRPNEKLVESIQFDSVNADFSGQMIMEVTFQPIEIGTRVTFLFKNIPKGIKPEDNEAGTISTLEKLAKYVEERSELAAKNRVAQ